MIEKKNTSNKRQAIPVMVSAEKLCCHTLKVTQNLNNFPKKWRFTLVDRLVSCSMDIFDNIQDANIFRGEQRIEYINRAISNCRKMKAYLRLVYEVLKPECSIPFWNDMVDDIEKQLTNWRASTKK